MTLWPVRLVAEGEPARHPSVINRPMSDVLAGSDYAPDGSDFEGFAKKGIAGIPGAFERTMTFPFGDGAGMDGPGAMRITSIGLNYTPVGWRIRAFDNTGAPTVVSVVFAVHRIAWDDSVVDLVDVGTPPSVVAATKAKGDPDNWAGGNGLDADYVRATIVSITPGAAVHLVLTIDVVPT